MNLTIGELKTMALGLRGQMDISHSASLEMVAKQLGFKDWNVLSAKAISNRPEWKLGARVRGEYLGHTFEGKLIAVRQYADEAHHAITVQFDKPVEVATLGDHKPTRVRVSAVVDLDGVTADKSSNGKPHMVVGLT